MAIPPLPRTARERRGQRRKPLDVAVELNFAGRQLCDARSADLTADGLGLLAPIGVAAGTRCSLYLSLPSASGAALGVEVQATAMHTLFSRGGGGFRIGLKFSDLSTTAAAAIAACMKA